MDHIPRFVFDGERYVREDHFLAMSPPNSVKIKVCIGYVVGGEPLKIPDGEYLLVPFPKEVI